MSRLGSVSLAKEDPWNGARSTRASLVHPREVFKGAFLANAAAIICAHNHPSGDLTPSHEDKALSDRLREAGQMLGVPLLDFLIVSDTDSWSGREHWSFT